MNSLDREHYKRNGSNKYHIDFNELEKNPSLIPLFFKKINKNDEIILQSIINNKSISENHKNIVVKIVKDYKTIEKEFKISKFLKKENLTGFINYISLFNCYDNTYDNLNVGVEENLKIVLIMPYINEGSIRTFKWNKDKYNALKSILSQTIMSVFMAYHLRGFLHQELHLDNILIKKTKKETINYKFKDEKDKNKIIDIEIKTYGYKIVIMDFENSVFVIKKKSTLTHYWNNLLSIIFRLYVNLKNDEEDDLRIYNLSDIVSFINKQDLSKGSYMNTLILLDMIRDLKFIVFDGIRKLIMQNNYEN